MSHRYLNLVNSPIGSKLASTVGLPRPAVLRRYRAEDPLLPGPVALGSTAGRVRAPLTKLVTKVGATIADGEGERYGALVLDARDVASPGDLAGIRDFLAPR